MCFLVGTLPNGLPFRHELAPGRTTVGRFEQSTIRLEEESISPLHAEIIRVDSRRYIVRDLHSLHGIAVDGQEVFEDEVTAPCRLTFGRLTCELLPEPPLEIALPKPKRASAVPPPPPEGLGVVPRPKLPKAQPDLGPAPWERTEFSLRKLRVIAIVLSVAAGVAMLALLSRQHPQPNSAVARAAAAPQVDFPDELPTSAVPTLATPLPVEEPAPAAVVAIADVTPEPVTSVESPAPSMVAPAPAEVVAPLAAAPERQTHAQPVALLVMAKEDVTGLVTPAVLARTTEAPAQEATSPETPAATEEPAATANAETPADEESAAPVESAEPAAATPTSEASPEPAPVVAKSSSWGFGAGGSQLDLSASGLLAATDLETALPPVAVGEFSASEAAPLTPAWQFGTSSPAVEVASLSRAGGTTPKPPVAPAAAPLKVLILGDSLALCGFGKRLDQRFRAASNVQATNTYMACGSLPLSWLKDAPYTNLKTFCGFWSIEEPMAGSRKPANFQDTYGMGHGKPKPHALPKIEDLLAQQRPDILVLQTGTNLFSLFRDGKTVQPERHGPQIRAQIVPFLTKLQKMPNAPRAIYWVASPVSGRISNEVQDYVLQQVRQFVGPVATVIDSRQLVSYPYKHPEPDNEHFTGSDMDDWADGVFDLVQKDLAKQPLPLALALPASLPAEKAPRAARPAPAPQDDASLVLTAKLVGKSQPYRLEQLRPYTESLVGYLYDVVQVEKGEYRDSQILVFHPGHIAEKGQTAALDKLKIGKTYQLKLRELNDSAWSSIKRRDDFGLIDLEEYIQVQDETRFPQSDQ